MATCSQCGRESGGGCYTNGDGYGDGNHVGIDPGPLRFYCWECAKYAPNHNSAITAAFQERGLCGFLEAWVGRCRNQRPCPKHAGEKCWKCGTPATSNCAHAGSFVCGMPQCEEHPHVHR